MSVEITNKRFACLRSALSVDSLVYSHTLCVVVSPTRAGQPISRCHHGNNSLSLSVYACDYSVRTYSLMFQCMFHFDRCCVHRSLCSLSLRLIPLLRTSPVFLITLCLSVKSNCYSLEARGSGDVTLVWFFSFHLTSFFVFRSLMDFIPVVLLSQMNSVIELLRASFWAFLRSLMQMRSNLSLGFRAFLSSTCNRASSIWTFPRSLLGECGPSPRTPHSSGSGPR